MEAGTGRGGSTKDLEGLFEELYKIDTQEQVAVHMCGFNVGQSGNYFRVVPVMRAELEVRLGKLQNEKTADKAEVMGEMVKGGGDMVVDWIWRLCNRVFKTILWA